MGHIHKRFTDAQVKELLQRYLQGSIPSKHIRQILGVRKTRFFALLKQYQAIPTTFTVQYARKTPPRLAKETERTILKELSIEKALIEDDSNPLKRYNYTYVKDRLARHYHQTVSVPTIIDRAKKHHFYAARPKKKAHDREVITNFAGELIQHDSSYHHWTPYVQDKWHMITSLDDYSRLILYAKILKDETSWAHIKAMESIFLKYGLPQSFYVDSHSIFRFVKGRDSVWYDLHKTTDQAIPQWKQVLYDCNVHVIYALSPQAKGKVERPYGWIQDHLVRTFAREQVTTLDHAQRILNDEVHRYNCHRIHSTTKEVPIQRFQNALDSHHSLFREFSVKKPFASIKDIFCVRVERTVDAYRKVSINNFTFRVNADPFSKIELRFYLLNQHYSEARVWHNSVLTDVLKLKNSDLKMVHF